MQTQSDSRGDADSASFTQEQLQCIGEFSRDHPDGFAALIDHTHRHASDTFYKQVDALMDAFPDNLPHVMDCILKGRPLDVAISNYIETVQRCYAESRGNYEEKLSRMAALQWEIDLGIRLEFATAEDYGAWLAETHTGELEVFNQE